MTNLKKLLTESSKIKRNRRVLLNIHIQVLAWLMEFLAAVIAIIMFYLPFARFATILANHFTGLGYFVLVPSVYLTNSDDFKKTIMKNRWYLAFTNMFFSNTINKIVPAQEVPAEAAIVDVAPAHDVEAAPADNNPVQEDLIESAPVDHIPAEGISAVPAPEITVHAQDVPTETTIPGILVQEGCEATHLTNVVRPQDVPAGDPSPDIIHVLAEATLTDVVREQVGSEETTFSTGISTQEDPEEPVLPNMVPAGKNDS